jgi:hypothetical protein
MATALDHLPPMVREARRTMGRSLIEDLRRWWQPPYLVELHSQSTDLSRMLGGAKTMPTQDEDSAGEQRRERIREWFAERDVSLIFERDNGGWLAVMIPNSLRAGAADAGHGRTRHEAAEDAMSRFLGTGDVGIQAPPAGATAEARAPIVKTATVAVSLRLEGVAETERAELETLRLDAVASDFGWQIAFAEEPDGSWFWIVVDVATREPLKWGREPTFEDAKIATVIDLVPPSGEA